MKRAASISQLPQRNDRVDRNRPGARAVRSARHSTGTDRPRRARSVEASASVDHTAPDAAAWKRMFDEFLSQRPLQYGEDQRPFQIEDDYDRHFSGNGVYAGVKSFLDSRGIRLAYGDPTDDDRADTICGLGNRLGSIDLSRIDPARSGSPNR